jgi:hypothetical protein
MAALRSGLRLAALGALALLAHGQQCTSGSHSSWSRVGHIDRITPVTTADGYGDNHSAAGRSTARPAATSF